MKILSESSGRSSGLPSSNSSQAGVEDGHSARSAATRLEAECSMLRDQLAQAKEREAELIAARNEAQAKATAKGEFLASMSHELRSPMTAVIGMAEVLMETPLSGEQRRMVQTVQSGAQALVNIVNDILDYSKLERAKLKLENRSYHPRECIEECLDLLAAQAASKRIELAYEMDFDTPRTLKGDPNRIRQVLMNLLSNALKFTDAGEVVVSVRSSDLGSNRTELAFSVRDTGVGIPPDRIRSLFRRYTQADESTARKYGGTGLGLAISLGLVELMGGTMQVESNVGEGSTFHFTIACEREAGPETYSDDQLTGKRVLIVDDNSTVLDIIRRQAEALGMSARCASSPEETMRCLDEDESFDVALIDRRLGASDGFTLAAEMKKSRPQLPLVAMIGVGGIYATNKAGGRDGVPRSFAAYVSRPVKPVRLRDAIRRAVQVEEEDPSVKREWVTAAAPADPNTTTTTHVADDRTTVLVVDDDLAIRKVAAAVLTRMGYEVSTASDGLAALEELQEKRYDIVMLDGNMPGLDGLQTAKRIGDQFPEDQRPYLIAVTGGTEEDRATWAAHGVNDYVKKPWKMSDMRLTMDRALASVMMRGRPAA